MSSWQHTAVHRDLSSSVQEGFNIYEWGCSAFATWSSLPCMSDCKLYCERAGNARLKGFVCLQKSRAGNGQDLIYLVLGIICWCCSKTIILLKWSRNHLLRAGLVFSLWKGAMPAHLVATGSVTTCTGRTDPKWGDSGWVLAPHCDCSERQCTFSNLFPFPPLSLLVLLLFSVVFYVVIISIYNVAACLTPPAPGCLEDQHCKQVMVSLNSKALAEITP